MDFFIFSISGVTFVTIVLLHILYGRSKSHRLPKGTLITLESGKLVFENLVLWIYVIPWFFLILLLGSEGDTLINSIQGNR